MTDYLFIPHGTVGGYMNHGCRCDACRAAKSAYDLAWRQARRGTTPPKHGEVGYRIYGCRCEVCRAGHSTKRTKDRRARRRLMKAIPEFIQHGAAAYIDGICQCPVCRTDRDRRYKGKTNATLGD